jgi:hypothetical protein
MAWIDFIGAASDMVERIVLRFGHLTETAELPPPGRFLATVVAGGLYEGTEVVSRLHRMADVLPTDCTLQRKLLFAAGRHADDPTTGLPLSLGEPRPLPRFQQRLETKSPKRLRAEELHDLWHAYTSAHRRDGLIGLYDAGCGVPAWSEIELALVQSLYEAGRPDEAESVLLAAREHFHPFFWWETLPHTPILSPGLRPAVTPRVKQVYLTQPVGTSL